MITAEQAHNITQERNRNKWVDHHLKQIFNTIEGYAKAGLRKCKIPVNFVGAEDLFELSTIACMIGKALDDCGFEHYITLENELIIEW